MAPKSRCLSPQFEFVYSIPYEMVWSKSFVLKDLILLFMFLLHAFDFANSEW